MKGLLILLLLTLCSAQSFFTLRGTMAGVWQATLTKPSEMSTYRVDFFSDNEASIYKINDKNESYNLAVSYFDNNALAKNFSLLISRSDDVIFNETLNFEVSEDQMRLESKFTVEDKDFRVIISDSNNIFVRIIEDDGVSTIIMKKGRSKTSNSKSALIAGLSTALTIRGFSFYKKISKARVAVKATKEE